MSSYSDKSNTFSKSHFNQLDFHQVKGTPEEELWNDYIDKYHYLGNKQLNGHSLKYLVYNGTKVLAALSWKAGSFRLRVRDHFIGWSPEQRENHHKRVINNSRFLLLPNNSVKNLGSYIMSKMLKRLPYHWNEYFGYCPWLVETFIDGQYFDGALYKASNWKHIGQTAGYGKGRYYNYHGNIKEVYIYELIKSYRQIIGCTTKDYDPFYRPPKWLSLIEDFKMIIRSKKWRPGIDPDLEISKEYLSGLSNELEQFHGLYSECYTRKEQEINGMVYFTGLFSSLPRKSVEPIALNYSPNSNVRGMQKFMKDSVWNEKKMQKIHQTKLMSIIADKNGMITLDPSDIAKKGKESVGVSRQYCGSTGKIDNCQCGIHMGYTSEKGYGLINSQLYMPEKWFNEEYAERRRKTLVPENLKFKTKNMIASELINKAFCGGVEAQWIGVDSAFGSDINFLDSLPKDKWYFAGIKSNEHVFPSCKETNKSISVSELGEKEGTIWQDAVLGEGAKGPIISKISLHRVFLSRKNKPIGKEVWLVIRKHADGKNRYAISNAPKNLPQIELIKASTMRWPIEQCFSDGKGYLGMDHYEHRSWVAWHRHMIFISLGLHLLLKLRLKSPSEKKLHI